MYAQHYGFSGRPFQLSPDHRFYFSSRSHEKALAYLSFGLSEREGFIVVTGEVGAGKTTLVRHLLSQLDAAKFVFANVVTTQLEADDALRMVASAFNLPQQGRNKATLLHDIEAFLADNHRRGKHVLLVVDEVQNMPVSALEELRMLSNFQLDNKPLLQCFLIGQPQFRRIMASSDMEQLRQRVIASCHLEPLEATETGNYIRHRLKMVGWREDPDFSDGAIELIHRHAGGVPRRINTLCGRLLLFGYLEDIHQFDEPVVMDVVRELDEEGTQLSSSGDINEFDTGVDLVGQAPSQAAPSQAAPSQPGYEDVLDSLARRVAHLKNAG